jgi:hypothetical protein
MQVHVILFRHANHDCHDVTEVYRDRAGAVRGLAAVASRHAREHDVAEAFARGDYETCLRLFAEECAAGADHQFAVIPAELS